LRQTPATSLPWGTIHWELWLRSQSAVNAKRLQALESLCPLFTFLGDFVLRTIGVVTVWAVHLGMIVLNVLALTVLSAVIFARKLVGFNHKTKLQPKPQPIQPQHSPAQQLPTPVNIKRMLPFLSGYDHSIVRFLESVFTSGFPLHFNWPRCSQKAPNLLSALQNPRVVSAKLSKELEAHRLAGPFSSPPFPIFRISPLGLVPKKVKGEFRLIHHLSYPRGSSLNDGISSEYTTVSYAIVENAIGLIKSVGPNCFLAKTGVKNAFRLIPIRPDSYDLLGIYWQGLYYYDRCMPMRCSSSCKTFEIFSTALEWI